MKVKCLYRLTPYGEIIESKYDTEVGLIDGVPEKMFHVVLDPSEWKTANYQVYGDNYPVSNMEEFMFKHRDCYCCIEFNNLGYFALINETAYIIVYDPDEPTPKYTLPKKQFDGKYVEIGLRPTKVRQLGIEPILYRLVFDTDTSKVVTQEGMFLTEFPIHGLGPVSTAGKGYVKLTQQNYFAVVYDKDGNEKYVTIQNGKVKFV